MKTKTLIKNYYIFLRDFSSDLFDDKLGHYASSLSWSTLFAIIPLLVVVLYIFTSLPLFDDIYGDIRTLIFSSLMPTESKIVMEYMDIFVASTDDLGYIGVVYVLFAIFMFFKNYDYIVNDIFDVPSRPFWKSIGVYSIFILTVPIMMGLSLYISSTLQSYLDMNSITDMIHLYSVIPYFIIWMMFYTAFQLSANVKIKISSALISSFITSLVWYISKSLFVFYVVFNKTYSTIYGSISILLFLFLWIYISWAIFIHGLKFCNMLNRDEEIDHI
ncbi:MAG: YihY family inner membrane protein [Sulfurovum sp.]